MIEYLSYLELLVAFVLPAVVALVTQKVRSSGFKGVALAALTAATVIASALIASQGVWTDATLYAGIESFTISVIAYFGLLKPAGITEKIAEKTSNFGV